MEDWLEQVREKSPHRSGQRNRCSRNTKTLKKKLKRCSPMVKRLLQNLAEAYWSDSKRFIRISRIVPMEKPIGMNPISSLFSTFQETIGWRVRNIREMEFFEVTLIPKREGFCFEVTNEIKTDDTSEQQLKAALLRSAMLGPGSLDDPYSQPWV